jgi:hypothetical protein
MLRCGDQIALHKEDADWLFKLTGVSPTKIHTADDLNRFVDQHFQAFDDSTPESRLLRMLLADEKIELVNVKIEGCLNRC